MSKEDKTKTMREKSLDDLTDNEKADLSEEAKKILGTDLYPQLQKALDVLKNAFNDEAVMEKLKERILKEDRE